MRHCIVKAATFVSLRAVDVAEQIWEAHQSRRASLRFGVNKPTLERLAKLFSSGSGFRVVQDADKTVVLDLVALTDMHFKQQAAARDSAGGAVAPARK